jgi:predicted aldo/keto reductase-like oxidoreductase
MLAREHGLLCDDFPIECNAVPNVGPHRRSSIRLRFGRLSYRNPQALEWGTARIIQAALDGGLSFMDNSWDYNGCVSEERLGRALKGGYRSRAFVMTKVDGRTKREAARQLDESLKRLGLDEIDLLQHHEVIRFDDADRIFAAGGAMEAFVAARKASKIRFIGFTGHKYPEVLLYMLETARQHFRFDTIQMPLNLFDTHYRSFEIRCCPNW